MSQARENLLLMSICLPPPPPHHPGVYRLPLATLSLVKTKASSTRIRIFLNPQLFLSEFKNSPSTRSIFKSNSSVHTHPMVSGFTLEVCRETRPTRYAAILVYCSVRDWTRFCYVIGFETMRIHHWHVADLIFSTLEERIKKYPDSLPNSPDACGRKLYPERKSCGFKNIRIRVGA